MSRANGWHMFITQFNQGRRDVDYLQRAKDAWAALGAGSVGPWAAVSLADAWPLGSQHVRAVVEDRGGFQRAVHTAVEAGLSGLACGMPSSMSCHAMFRFPHARGAAASPCGHASTPRILFYDI